MPNVKVTFSASIKDLIESTNQVKGVIDSVTEQATAANAALAKFGEFAGISIGIDGIKRLVASMAELGEHTESMAAELGLSMTSVQQFGYLAKLSGTDADSLARSMARFQLAITQAQNPTSRQAAALRAFGLSAKDLIGLPLDAQMDKFAAAVSRFADGTGKTAAIEALNRALVPLIPLLDQGAGGLAKVRQQAIDAGEVISKQTVESLSALYRQNVTVKSSLDALGAELVALASKTLIEFANSLATSAGNMVKLIESGNLTKYMLADLRGQIEELIAGLGKMGTAIGDAFSGRWGAQFTADMKAADGIITATAQHHAAELAKILADSDAAYKSILAHQEGQSKKPQVAPVDVNRGNENSARMSALNAEIALKDKDYQADVAHANAMQKIGMMTEQQKTATLTAAVNAREDSELQLLNDEEAKGGLSVQQYQEIENKKTAIYAKAIADRQKLVDQQSESEVKTAKAVADQVAGAFNSQLRSMLSGHETFAQGMKAAFADMVEKMIADLVKLAAEWIAVHVIMAEAKAIFDAMTGNFGGAAMATAGAAAMGGISGGISAHAKGGTLGAGNWGIAGEAGPELIMGPAHVLPAGLTSALARVAGPSSQQSNSTTNADNRQVHVHMSAGTGNWNDHARNIAKAVVDHWKSNPSTRPKGW